MLSDGDCELLMSSCRFIKFVVHLLGIKRGILMIGVSWNFIVKQYNSVNVARDIVTNEDSFILSYSKFNIVNLNYFICTVIIDWCVAHPWVFLHSQFDIKRF